jgi:hypothetical protein
VRECGRDRPTLSATDVFIDAVEGLCLRDATLANVTEAATALHDASDLAVPGTATVSLLLHAFRARAGSRSAEWWPSKDRDRAHSQPSSEPSPAVVTPSLRGFVGRIPTGSVTVTVVPRPTWLVS